MGWLVKKNGMKVLVALFSVVSVVAHANTNTLIQDEIDQAHHIEKTKQQNVFALQTLSSKSATHYSTWVQDHVIKRQTTYAKQQKTTPEALVFVSLGMPKHVLEQTLEDAQTFHIPVVIRGLVDHSFRKTMSVIFNLLKNKAGKKISGVLIDPLWFRQFHITTVPSVVVSHQRLCRSQNHCAMSFDVVRGNIPVQRALEIIARDGNAAPEMARTLLKEYGHA